MAKNSSKASLINAVSDWLKLLALIVVVADGLLAVAYYATKDSDPFRKYYFPLMIGFLALIVVGVFVDRVLSARIPGSTILTGSSEPTRLSLVSRWYFRLGVMEEQLDLTIIGNKVTGTRKTIDYARVEKTYKVTGWQHSSTYWLEYHDVPEEYGGGSILLHMVTNDRFSGMVLSRDCTTGIMQCRANMWFPPKLKKIHKQEFFKIIGSIPSSGTAMEENPGHSSGPPNVTPASQNS